MVGRVTVFQLFKILARVLELDDYVVAQLILVEAFLSFDLFQSWLFYILYYLIADIWHLFVFITHNLSQKLLFSAFNVVDKVQ